MRELKTQFNIFLHSRLRPVNLRVLDHLFDLVRECGAHGTSLSGDLNTHLILDDVVLLGAAPQIADAVRLEGKGDKLL